MVDKRERRTKAEILELRRAIAEIVEQHRPLTVRHLFYLMVSAGLIPKTEDAYKNVTIRLAGQMREDWLYRMQHHGFSSEVLDWAGKLIEAGKREDPKLTELIDEMPAVIPFGNEDIVDATRWIRKPRTYAGQEAALRNVRDFYRRDLWADQDCYVAFFCEKEAVADLVYSETAQWDVPLAVMRGDAPKALLWDTAKAIEAENKPAFLYFLGDFDVKGQQIIKSAFERIQRYAVDAEIGYEILAVTMEQIAEYNLPTRPEKTDASKQAVELDALPPEILRTLINQAIERHVPREAMEALRVAEDSEREIFTRIANRLPEVRDLVMDGLSNA